MLQFSRFFGVFTNPDIPVAEGGENSGTNSQQQQRFHGQPEFHWDSESRVRLHKSFTISYFTPDGKPHLMSNDDLEKVTVSIKRQNGTRPHTDTDVGSYTETAFTIEFTDQKFHVVKFGVQKPGTYVIAVKIDNEHIKGSPFFHKFAPGLVCPKKSTLRCICSSACFTVGDVHAMTLQLLDTFENLCEEKDFVPKLVCLTIEHMDSNGHGRKLNKRDFDLRMSCDGSGKLNLSIEVHQCGIFWAGLEYDKQLVQNGNFSFVVLTGTEMDSMAAFLRQHPLGPYVFDVKFEYKTPESDDSSDIDPSMNECSHDGRLLVSRSTASGPLRKPKVKVIVTPNNVFVSKTFLMFFRKRILSAKLTLETCVNIVSVDLFNDTTTFEVSDGYFHKVTLTVSSGVLRIATAILTHFVGKRLGKTATFSEKLMFFYEKVRSSREQLHYNATRVQISVDRADLLMTAFRQTERFKKIDWFRVFKIDFRREVGVDGGGIRREFFELLCIQLFETSGLFKPMGNSRLVHPTPKVERDPRWDGRTYDRMWQFAGKIVAKCLFESAIGGPFKLHVKAKFSRSFLAQLLGLSPDYKHFEHDDPELYTGKIKYILDNDVTPLELKFTDEEYLDHARVKVIDLIPNGSSIPVTEENKQVYLSYLAIYRLQKRVKREIRNFSHGLISLVTEDAIGIFDENELELLICGKSTFTLNEFRIYHYVAFEHFEQPYISTHSRIIDWFWIVVGKMTEDDKGRLLQFITGSSILPTGGLRRLVPMIEIKPLDEFGRFPQAHTCNNQLCLPDQPNVETFERRLHLAITEGCQGFEII